MSDDIENTNVSEEPPKRGRGRPPKSKQKTPTNKEVEDAVLELHMPAVKVLAKLLKSDSEQVKLKAAIKVDELARDIQERRKEAGQGEQEAESEQKANGTTGGNSRVKVPVQSSSVVQFNSPKKVDDKVKKEKEEEDK